MLLFLFDCKYFDYGKQIQLLTLKSSEVFVDLCFPFRGIPKAFGGIQVAFQIFFTMHCNDFLVFLCDKQVEILLKLSRNCEEFVLAL